MPQRIAVVGSGYMGGGIAQVFALAGHTVLLADGSADLASAARERLIAEGERYAALGLFPADAPDLLEQNLVAAASIQEAVADADFIEEAVPEIPEVKRTTLAAVSAAAPARAVIGSNTSTLSIGSLAGAVTGPERFLGVHFSNPAPFVPGVEVIGHAGTEPAAVETALGLLAAVGKQGFAIADVPGFVLNRLQYALFGEAARLVEEGVASAADIDAIVRTTFGYRLPFFGPFAIADMAGLDVYAFCYASLHEAYPERFSAPRVLGEHVDRGEFGVKSGRGFLATAPEAAPELAAYRDRAYGALARLLSELGPAPVQY